MKNIRKSIPKGKRNISLKNIRGDFFDSSREALEWNRPGLGHENGSGSLNSSGHTYTYTRLQCCHNVLGPANAFITPEGLLGISSDFCRSGKFLAKF